MYRTETTVGSAHVMAAGCRVVALSHIVNPGSAGLRCVVFGHLWPDRHRTSHISYLLSTSCDQTAN